MIATWTQSCHAAAVAHGILHRAGLPGETYPVDGGACVFLPTRIRAIDVAKILVLFPGSRYDHVAMTVMIAL